MKSKLVDALMAAGLSESDAIELVQEARRVQIALAAKELADALVAEVFSEEGDNEQAEES